MFTFQRFYQGGKDWSDNLFFNDSHVGVLGRDKEGLFISLKRDLTLSEITLLVAQISINIPESAGIPVTFQKDEE